MAGVFQNIDLPSPSPPVECVPPAFGAGGGHTCREERGVGSIFWKTSDTTKYITTANRTYAVLHCRLCHVTRQPDSKIKSHRTGDPTCPKISAADRQYIEAARATLHLNAVDTLPIKDGISAVADSDGYDQEDLTVSNLQEEHVSTARSANRMRLGIRDKTHSTSLPLYRTLTSRKKHNENAVPR
jgi:hypothetical protein